jgi:hypothetical protein|tara:strand:+ start:2276 stop:2656 length:381 start_codon:yes stop_codon:yes gene_type:complete
MSRKLTEKQQRFLDILFEEAKGNLSAARDLAGYSKDSGVADIVRGLKDEILEATKLYMARNTPAAAFAIVSGISDPTQLGLKERLNAAKDLLDRSGIIKSERLQVQSSGGVMILPPKETLDEDDDS